MLFAEFFTWWYSRGFIELFMRLRRSIVGIWSKLSVTILLKTLFEPWRRIVSESGGSIRDKSRALVDNAVSRMVGFVIRISVIIAALVVIILICLVGALLLVLWPAAPLLVPLTLILGLAR